MIRPLKTSFFSIDRCVYITYSSLPPGEFVTYTDDIGAPIGAAVYADYDSGGALHGIEILDMDPSTLAFAKGWCEASGLAWPEEVSWKAEEGDDGLGFKRHNISIYSSRRGAWWHCACGATGGGYNGAVNASAAGALHIKAVTAQDATRSLAIDFPKRSWYCTCGASGGGYVNVGEAEAAMRRHTCLTRQRDLPLEPPPLH